MRRRNGRELTMQQIALRILCWLVAGLIALLGAEAALDLWLTGKSPGELALDPEASRALASTIARTYGSLVALVFTFIAIAIPITANMYTPKLIEIFARDRTNLAAMVFFAGVAAHAVFSQSLQLGWAPPVQFAVLAVSGTLGFALVIPYYLYVLTFLNPSTIIGRVTQRILDEFDLLAADGGAGDVDVPAVRRRLHEKVLHLGNVILRAIDRADRDVSLDAIAALRKVVTRYDDLKPELPAAWFEVEDEVVLGLSRYAAELIVRERTWVEHRCLSQLSLAFTAALMRMPDAVSAISDVNRRIAIHAQLRGDRCALGLCIRFFNTFIRETIKRRDSHAVYDVLYQYRCLARDLVDREPGVVVEIAGHMRYYGAFARAQGVASVYELAAYEIARIIELAYERETPTRRELLEILLGLDQEGASGRLTKAKAILAASLADAGHADEVRLLQESIARRDPKLIQEARRALLATHDPVFWEITDRQRNLDYVEPEHRPTVGRLLEEALAMAEARAGAAARP